MKLDESGNILISLTITLLIMGALGYFLSLSDRVDSEIRILGGTQQTAFMKSDLRETIRKTLMGTNSECPITSTFRAKFINLNAPKSEAAYSYKRVDKDIKADPVAKCFFHPSRYNGVKIREIDIDFMRASEPNYITLSSFVTATARIEVVADNRISQLKFSLRYRIDVLTLNHFGLISETTGQLIEPQNGASVQVNGNVLLDQADRTKKISLDRLMADDFRKVKYNKSFSIAAPGLGLSSSSTEFLKKHKIRDVFAYGIDFNALPQGSSFKAPYQQKLSTQWKDMFNYEVMDKIYPLPRLSSGMSAVSSPNIGIIYQYDRDKQNKPFSPESVGKDTAQIYQKLYGHKRDLAKSCDYSDLSSGQFNLFIFNNFSEDFTIDFSANTSADHPPVFCGLIAARNLTVILNNQTSEALSQNHFIGKIILKGNIKVINRGVLHINDIMEVSSDELPYPVSDLGNIKLQYYNQKYFSAQNFNLPFFTNQSVYSSSAPEIQYYVPRDTKEFFTKPCGSFYCRLDEIGVPEARTIINNHANDLLYEVYSVE